MATQISWALGVFPWVGMQGRLHVRRLAMTRSSGANPQKMRSHAGSISNKILWLMDVDNRMGAIRDRRIVFHSRHSFLNSICNRSEQLQVLNGLVLQFTVLRCHSSSAQSFDIYINIHIDKHPRTWDFLATRNVLPSPDQKCPSRCWEHLDFQCAISGRLGNPTRLTPNQ